MKDASIDIFQTTPKHIVRKLKRDATRLALRMESQGEDLSLLQIEVPEKEANKIYQQLLQIYNSGLPEAEAIFNCNLRVATDIPIDKFWIIYEKDSDWASDLADGINEVSGDIEDLLDDYDLFITDRKNWDETHDIITIESAKLYNIAALSQKFESISGVFKVNTHDADISPDFDINIKKIDGKWNFSFIRYWSSLDKTKSHRWEFNVTDDKEVFFLNESGDEFPDWMKCQLIAELEQF